MRVFVEGPGSDGSESAGRAVSFGLRQIEFAPNATPDETASRMLDLQPLLALPGTSRAAQAAGACPKWQVRLANTGQTAALGVQIEDTRPPEASGRLYFADNYFHLLPGARRLIEVAWHGPAGEGLRPTISAWNAIAPPLDLC